MASLLFPPRSYGLGLGVVPGFPFSILSKFIDPGFMFVRVSNKASKITVPCGKPEVNATHKMCCAVSLEIDLMGGFNTHVFIT
jgi:hypothetical protein